MQIHSFVLLEVSKYGCSFWKTTGYKFTLISVKETSTVWQAWRTNGGGVGDRKFYLDFRSHLPFFAYRLTHFLRHCSTAMLSPASAILTLGVTSLIERDCSFCQMISHGLTNCNHTCTHRTYILKRPKPKLEECWDDNRRAQLASLGVTSAARTSGPHHIF